VTRWTRINPHYRCRRLFGGRNHEAQAYPECALPKGDTFLDLCRKDRDQRALAAPCPGAAGGVPRGHGAGKHARIPQVRNFWSITLQRLVARIESGQASHQWQAAALAALCGTQFAIMRPQAKGTRAHRGQNMVI